MNLLSWVSCFNFFRNQSNGKGIHGYDPNKGCGDTMYPQNHKSKKQAKKKRKNRSGKKARKANRNKGGK